MKIRRMTPADHDPCIAMMKDFYHSPAVSHALPVAVHERAFQAAVEGEPMMEGLVLEEDGQIAGYAMISFTYSCEVGGRVALLEELYFKEEFRGRGLGHQYFQWVFDTYGEMARLRLEVTAANPRAQALYQRLGFEVLDYIQMVKDKPRD